MSRLALIGGTGLENLSLQDYDQETVQTPYGEVQVDLGRIGESKKRLFS